MQDKRLNPTATVLSGIVACVMLLTGCALDSDGARPDDVTASGPPAATALVTSTRRQRFAGFGTAVATDTEIDPWAQTAGLTAKQVRDLDALALGAGIRLIRIFGPGQSPGPGGTRVWTPRDGRLRLMRRLRGRGVRFMFTGQGAPATLVQGGGETGPLLAGSERDYARFLAENLEVAARAGTPFAIAAIGNEVDNASDPGVSLTSGQTAAATRELARQIKRRGLRTRVALGDNTAWDKTLRYATAQASSLGGGSRPAIVASHAYGGDAQRSDVARFARRRRLPVWMTEWVSACPNGQCPDDPSIAFALRWAEEITTDLTVGGASAWFMFRGVSDASHGPDGAIVLRDRAHPEKPLSTTKRYPIVRQFATAAPPGSLRVDARVQGAPEVRALAFTGPRRRSLVLTHTGAEAIRLEAVLGKGGGTISGWLTSAADDFRRFTKRRVSSGRLTVTLPSHSVTTLVLRERR